MSILRHNFVSFFTHDRLGRITSAIVDGVSTNLYSYDALTLALTNEISYGRSSVSALTRTYDALGRPTGLSLGPDYAVEYGYDTYGRFSSVTSHWPLATSHYQYSYLPGTDLLAGYTAGDFTRTVSYEPYRSLITSVENKHNSTTISRYDYTNDALGRRTAISRSGTAFGTMPVRDSYGYNHRSEVTSARRTLVANPSQEIRGFSYDYAYDPIGNRISSTEYDPENNALISSYTANALNQYQQRTIPGYAAVRGTATNTAVVTVNGNSVWRLDDYFYGGDEADNSTAATMKELEIIAAHSNHYAAATGHVFVAQTPEVFQYDDDGNLTQDSRFTYAWDAENRLTGITTRDDLPASVPRVRITHRYDHQSRRVATKRAIWSGADWQAAGDNRYLYDSWNVVAETRSAAPANTNLYVWGLDLSGTLQGAGGIGGLLTVRKRLEDGTGIVRNYDYLFDGNGNVVQEILRTDGAINAHYEYDPFGNTVVALRLDATDNPFRFSTKWFDNDTGLGYWGYRWYSPEMVRWISKDPIGELGGHNIYSIIDNAPIEKWDYLGLAWISPNPNWPPFIKIPGPGKGAGGTVLAVALLNAAQQLALDSMKACDGLCVKASECLSCCNTATYAGLAAALGAVVLANIECFKAGHPLAIAACIGAVDYYYKSIVDTIVDAQDKCSSGCHDNPL